MWLEMLEQIFDLCIVPLLGILTTYLIKLVNNKINEIKIENNDRTVQKYLDMLNQTITDCVIATSQTYVESLKKDKAFDAEAQKKAFQLTYDAIINIMSEDAKVYLTEAVGDLQLYIQQKIEAEVNINKASV